MWPTKISPELKTIRYFLQDIRRNKCNYNFSVFVLFSETFDLPMYSPYLESQGKKKVEVLPQACTGAGDMTQRTLVWNQKQRETQQWLPRDEGVKVCQWHSLLRCRVAFLAWGSNVMLVIWHPSAIAIYSVQVFSCKKLAFYSCSHQIIKKTSSDGKSSISKAEIFVFLFFSQSLLVTNK